ncbi:hypothetical protein ABBQ38_014005 [Trebouxia sp. C0009 RCD-2024]
MRLCSKVLVGILAIAAIIAIIAGLFVGVRRHIGNSNIDPATLTCGGKKGVVYDYFFQFCPAVTMTNSSWWLNFDAGVDYSCSDPEVLARHQPMVFGTDRIRSSYAAITALPEYAKPSFLLTFNEPNYAHLANDISSNIVDPATAASLWPQLLELFPPLGIQLVAPSPINCAGDVNCRNVGTAAGWLTAFQEALDGNPATRGAWETVHALSYHTYATDFDTIVNETTSLHQQFSKPLWITEIASGADSTAAANLALMQRFVPWANSQPWIERYFWNQATPAQVKDPNIQNSYLVNRSVTGLGNGSLTALGQTYRSFPC